VIGEALRRASLGYLRGEGANTAAPPAVGQKFTGEGRVLGYAGNTFLCHIPPGPAHQALTHAAERLRAGPLAGAFAFLPPASYHMTVFEGVTDKDRSQGRWPAWIDPTASVDAVTTGLLPKLAQLNLPAKTSIRPTALFGGFSLRVEGATDADNAALRQARETLRRATGICRPDFADYTFHVTLAYLLRWLTPDEAESVMCLSDEVAAALAADAPQINLGGIEFCGFADMHAFPLIARLS
jgi:hypothetical protein